MRIKKTNTILGTAVLLGSVTFLYLFLQEGNESGSSLYGNPDAQKLELKNLEAKLQNLENDLEMNGKIIQDIKGVVKDILLAQQKTKEEEGEGEKGDVAAKKAATAVGGFRVNKTMAVISRLDVGFAQALPAPCDVEMDKVYDQLEFDNPDGGVWKQGWDITYQAAAYGAHRRLKVFLVPHSHNDPGWIKTFEKYYADQTSKILSLMVMKLKQFPNMKFIWAEISYLALWWAEQNSQVRQQFVELVQEERLEIVTGGWVMPDEANSHYSAILEQLIFGHEWCHKNLRGYKPNSGWAIDPFGMSPTMAYILRRAGLDNMLIQRTHYNIKKKLAQDRNLEFRWRQHWDHENTTDMLCHMMPFYSYDVPHTCGPDPKICCQFDFLRLPGGRVTCPWNVPPRAITENNVGERAALLMDQYKKKAQLYRTDALFVPLGDDFRWDSAREWDDQYHNYQRIMDHVNSHPELGVDFQWGTLSDYFKAIRKQSETETKEETGLFPSLSGDFFTYADRDDHYWSGYFTSRPFWKNLDRVLGGYLRAGEILFSLAWAEMEYIGSDKTDLANECMKKLVFARKSLGLFQHHDGITGTAKDHVVLDYGEKMLNSIKAMQYVIQQSANLLLSKTRVQYQPRTDTAYFDLDDNRESSWSLPKQSVITVEEGQVNRVVIVNSHARRRQQMVTLRVSTFNIKVFSMVKYEEGEEQEEEDIACQISPVFTPDGELSNSEYELTFLATVPALGLETFFIRPLKSDEEPSEQTSIATLRLFHSDKQPFQVEPFANVEISDEGENFSLANVHISADFGPDGLLQSITSLADGERTACHLDFVRYGTRHSGDRSGAYLFLPDGPGRVSAVSRSLVRVVEGRLRAYVEVRQGWNTHRATLFNSPGVDGTGVLIENEVNIVETGHDNIEMSMRLSSDIQSNDTFFTDLNGFQMIRRKRYEKLPLQANWYPLPSMAYIQDKKSRLSLISGQPLGGTSLAPGQLEVMLDRRLSQDDNRGLFQGVLDNKVTLQTFVLVLERQVAGCLQEPEASPASYPSLLGHAVRHDLLHPFFRLIYKQDQIEGNKLRTSYSPVSKNLDCDIHLINLRTMLHNPDSLTPDDKTALVLHRQGFNSCYRPIGLTCSTSGGKVSLEELFPNLYSNSVSQMSLSLMYEGIKMEKSFTVSIQPMEMYSFLLSR